VDAEGWQARDVKGARFEPEMGEEARDSLLKGWSAALRRTLA
jgi:glycerol kinase